jgi:polyisoprenoid-binding protein YceI
MTWLLVVLFSAGIAAAAASGGRSFAVDRARSHATIDVGKSGPLSFLAGHTHEVLAPALSGVVEVDSQDWPRSTVRIDIDASALKVTGKGDPPKDVPEIQRVMASDKVLDVARYPTITFVSTGVSVTARAGATVDLAVTGKLTLHNVTRSHTVPIRVRLEGDSLTATGRFSVKQTDHGIKPVSVAGAVAVKDALEISFTIVARERGGR